MNTEEECPHNVPHLSSLYRVLFTAQHHTCQAKTWEALQIRACLRWKRTLTINTSQQCFLSSCNVQPPCHGMQGPAQGLSHSRCLPRGEVMSSFNAIMEGVGPHGVAMVCKLMASVGTLQSSLKEQGFVHSSPGPSLPPSSSIILGQ